jgi:hypothetical protein
MYAESWAIPFVVLGVALVEIAAGRTRWRPLLAAGVASLVIASLFREIALIGLVAGLIAAWMGPRDRRRWSLVAWGIGLGTVGVALLAHYLAVGSATHGEGAGWLFNPSLLNVAAGLQTGTERLASEWWVVALLALLAIAGIAARKERSRVFVALMVGMPMLAFALVRNGGLDVHVQGMVNYWGALFNPVIYGLVPWALAALPGGAKADAGAEETS